MANGQNGGDDATPPLQLVVNPTGPLLPNVAATSDPAVPSAGAGASAPAPATGPNALGGTYTGSINLNDPTEYVSGGNYSAFGSDPPWGRMQIPAHEPNLPQDVPQNPADRWDKLYRIRQAESGNRNVPTDILDASGKLASTASGYYQMIDETWNRALDYAGLPHRWARAMDAPPAVQDQVAYALMTHEGTVPWVSSQHKWSDPNLQYDKGYSGSYAQQGTDTLRPIYNQGGGPVPGATPGAESPNALAIANRLGPGGPGMDQNTDQMRKLMAYSMLRSMLGEGLGFQKIQYNPWDVREFGNRSGINVGTGRGMVEGLPGLAQATRLPTETGPGATSPRRAGRRPKQSGAED